MFLKRKIKNLLLKKIYESLKDKPTKSVSVGLIDIELMEILFK